MARGGLEGLTVVIPVLNEAGCVGRVIEEVLDAGIPRGRILVVDGGSTDGTREEAASYGVRVVVQDGRGKADAIRTAARLVDTEYVAVIDGDGTYPAREIPRLYSKALEEGLDEVIGARVYTRGSQPAVLRVGNRILTWLFNVIFGTRLSDVLSGLYVVRSRVLREIPYASRHFGIESEIAAHVAATTGRVGEVRVEYRPRCRPEAKKLRARHGVSIALDMLRMAWHYNPAFLMFAVGAALLLAPGLALGGWVAYRMLAYGVVHHVKGVAALVLASSGLVSLLLAINALFVKRVEFRIRRMLEAMGGRAA